MDQGFVATIVVFFIFGAPVTAWIISRVLAHQERIEMIRNGYMPPPDRNMMRNARYGSWQGGPIPPPPPQGAPVPPNVPQYHDGFYAQAQMRKGIMVALIGFALLIGLGTIGHGYPGPWLLGGLIPLFVGIAQIINAVLNGASLPMFGQGAAAGSYGPRPMNQGQPQPPPQQPPSGGPSASGYSGPYGWRPGPTPEIEKPVQPPDHR